jgi:hypothetical protein
VVARGERAARTLRERAQRFALRAPGALGGQPRCETFELDAQLEDLLQVRGVELGDERAAPGEDHDEVLPGQASQGAAHGSQTHSQLGCERGLVDDRARRQLERDDARPDARVGDVAERVGRVPSPLTRDARRSGSWRAGGRILRTSRLKFHRRMQYARPPRGGQAAASGSEAA